MKSCTQPAARPVLPARILLATLALGMLAAGAPAARAAENARLIRSPDGVPICIFETGNPAGPPIVFVHGFSQSYAVFKLQFQSDLARDFRLLAYDLRGHGCSGKPWDARYYTAKLIAGDMAAVLAEFKVQRPLLVGWSYGGYVVMDYVRRYGDQHLAGAMLVGSNAGLPPPPTDPAVIERTRVARENNRKASPDIAAGMQNGHTFVQLMTVKPAPPDMAEIMFATNQMLPAYARRAMVGRNLQNDDVIPKLHMPILLLAGEKDLSQPASVLNAVAGKLAHGRVVLVPDAGHATFIDAPEAFERELRQFAAAVAPR
jgi:pimeloyl-ACP methyl ester carboxylesterase